MTENTSKCAYCGHAAHPRGQKCGVPNPVKPCKCKAGAMESKLGTCNRYKGEIPHVKDRKHKCDGWREQPLDYADIGENFEKIMEFCCKFADTVAKLRRTEFWQGVPARARRGICAKHFSLDRMGRSSAKEGRDGK